MRNLLQFLAKLSPIGVGEGDDIDSRGCDAQEKSFIFPIDKGIWGFL
jgi:hypothetical protein